MEEKKNNFTIDVTPIYTGEKTELEFSFVLPDDYVPCGKDMELSSAVTASGKLIETASGNLGTVGYVELILSVRTSIKSECARCLEPVESDFIVEAKYGVTPFLQNAEESESFVMTTDNRLDIGETARTLFLLNLPTRFLCSDDCKGLCQDCGANLNKEKCRCKGKNVDPRLSALKNYFGDSGK